MSKDRIIRNCDKCGNEDSINTINGLCVSCEMRIKEREFLDKVKEKNESLRGFSDCLIVRVYYSFDKNGNVILDEDSLKEDFEMRLRELQEISEGEE